MREGRRHVFRLAVSLYLDRGLAGVGAKEKIANTLFLLFFFLSLPLMKGKKGGRRRGLALARTKRRT